MREVIKRNKILLICFLFNFLLGVVTFLPFMIAEGGRFSLGVDYDHIIMPTFRITRDAIWKGDIFWNWEFDLGTDFIGLSGYLVLGSPFFWLSVLFPNIDYLYLGGWLFILKYAVTGMMAGVYLRRFLQKEKYVLLGSILYAFSGFQAVNVMFGSFHDAVALFPLLLWGLETLLTDGKKGRFAIAVAINALVNYYLFVGEVVFCILYFIFRFWWEERKYYKKIPVCIGEGILGITIAGGVWIPSILFSLQNPRSGQFLPLSNWLPLNSIELLKLCRTFFFPGEMMQAWSSVMKADWSSSSAYLPFVGMTLVFVYLWRNIKKKDWLKRMCVVCLVFMCIPVLSSMFTLFTDHYSRWYYMPLLLFSLASVRVLENASEYPIQKGAAIMLTFLVMILVGFSVWNHFRYQIIYEETAYWILNSTAIIGVLIIWLLPKFLSQEKILFKTVFCLTAVFSVFTTAYTCFRYQEIRGYEVTEYEYHMEVCENLGKLVDVEREPYRMVNIDNRIAASAKIPAVGSSFNTVQGSVFILWNVLGEDRRVVCPPIPEGFYNLTGAKYEFSSQIITEEGYRLLGQEETPIKTYYLYEKEESRSIGTTYDAYIKESEFLQLEKEERALVMLEAVVIADEEEVLVGNVLKPWNGSEGQHGDINNYLRDERGFSCTVQTGEQCALLFSVPYADGWSAYINGEKVPILETAGFMTIMVEPGESEIRFSYFNKAVFWGLLSSLLGLVIWAILIKRSWTGVRV
ncbi:MAG: YfhO family protein [Lachnospiraceae bacterium]|nr:YfhO family protein [Lachnospiraceae bacterium]